MVSTTFSSHYTPIDDEMRQLLSYLNECSEKRGLSEMDLIKGALLYTAANIIMSGNQPTIIATESESEQAHAFLSMFQKAGYLLHMSVEIKR